MYKFFAVLLLFVALACSPNEDNKEPEMQQSEMTKTEKVNLAQEIQDDFFNMGSQIAELEIDAIEKFNSGYVKFEEKVAKVGDKMQSSESEISEDALHEAAVLYGELAKLYKQAGFETAELEKKIEKLHGSGHSH